MFSIAPYYKIRQKVNLKCTGTNAYCCVDKNIIFLQFTDIGCNTVLHCGFKCIVRCIPLFNV